MKKFGRKTTLNLRYGSDKGSHSVVPDWKGYDFMEIVKKKETNADRIRNMSDEELDRFIHNISVYSEDEEPIIDVCIRETRTTLYNDCVDILEWLQSEAEQERKWKIDIYSRQKGLTTENGFLAILRDMDIQGKKNTI